MAGDALYSAFTPFTGVEILSIDPQILPLKKGKAKYTLEVIIS